MGEMLNHTSMAHSMLHLSAPRHEIGVPVFQSQSIETAWNRYTGLYYRTVLILHMAPLLDLGSRVCTAGATDKTQ